MAESPPLTPELAKRMLASRREREKDQPSMLKKAGNLASAVVGHVADGGRIAPPEVQAAREAECFACPHHDHPKDGCSACGCGVIGALSFVGLDLALKRSWASSRCPLKVPKWGPV